jgi:hypothetical protein
MARCGTILRSGHGSLIHPARAQVAVRIAAKEYPARQVDCAQANVYGS